MGPDGGLWFTENAFDAFGSSVNSGVIGRLSGRGRITLYFLPRPRPGLTGATPYSIVAGPDGAMWFTERDGNAIGRITTTGHIREYPLPTGRPMRNGVGRDDIPGRTGSSEPGDIVTGPDGALWFTEEYADRIGRITRGGHVHEYALPDAQPRSDGGSLGPTGLTVGPGGALWFVLGNRDRIVRFTLSGRATYFELPHTEQQDMTYAFGQPNGLAHGSGGSLWFSEVGGVGRFRFPDCVTVYRTTSPAPLDPDMPDDPPGRVPPRAC